MRILLLLVATALLLFGAILWRLGQPVEAAIPPPADSGEGLILLGLPAAATLPVPPAPPLAKPGIPELPLPGLAAPEPPPIPEPAPAPPPPLPTTHQVQDGESLYGIVRRYWGQATPALVESLANANRLVDASALEVGQILRLPPSLDGIPQQSP